MSRPHRILLVDDDPSIHDAYAKILGGLRGRLLLEADHGGSWVQGPIEVEFCMTDELEVEHEDQLPDTDDDELVAVLASSLRRELEDADDAMAYGEAISEALVNKRAIFE